MKRVIWKIFVDYEKEEQWLNYMASKGWAMIDFSFCRYVFVKSEPSEYTYRLELLDNLPTHHESRDYIDFLKETGIEHVDSWARWIYLRKRTRGESFELRTDLDSKINHYKRILYLFAFGFGVNLFTAAFNTFNAFNSRSYFFENGEMVRKGIYTPMLVIVFLNSLVAVLLGYAAFRTYQKLCILKKSKDIEG